MLDKHVPTGVQGGGAFSGGGQRLGSGGAGAGSSGPSDLYFSGTVPEAIQQSKSSGKPLVVFLEGHDLDSK